jgi:hypothetical protein
LLSASGAGIGEPQTPQNVWRKPEGSWKTSICSLPRSQRKLLFAVSNPVLNAVPLVLRHRLQWQVCIGLTRPSISNADAPQRQLPRIITLPYFVASVAHFSVASIDRSL